MKTKHCPIRGCEALILKTAAVCSECWRRLPHSLQHRIDWMDQTTRHAESYREALDYLNRLPPLPSDRRPLVGVS